MIKLSVQTGGMEEKLGLDATYALVKETGFEAVDANIDHLLSGSDIRKHIMPEALLSDDEETIRELFRPWKEAAEKYGIQNYQAHAPFPTIETADPDPEYNAKLVKMLRTMIRGCAYIGCGNLVVHPASIALKPGMTMQDEWDLNMDMYTQLIDDAKKYGVTILLENMFVGHHARLFGGCCSNAEQARTMIDALNEKAGAEVFGFCLDTGHLLLLGLDVVNFMTDLGSRIKAFHVHDNDGIGDQHLAPYMGIQDWDRFAEGLKRIGYDSVMSFETFNMWNRVDEEIAPYVLKTIERTGRMLARKAAE